MKKVNIDNNDHITLFNKLTWKTDAFKQSLSTITGDEHITLDVSTFKQGNSFNQQSSYLELQAFLINNNLDDNITLVGQNPSWIGYDNYGQP